MIVSIAIIDLRETLVGQKEFLLQVRGNEQ